MVQGKLKIGMNVHVLTWQAADNVIGLLLSILTNNLINLIKIFLPSSHFLASCLFSLHLEHSLPWDQTSLR